MAGIRRFPYPLSVEELQVEKKDPRVHMGDGTPFRESAWVLMGLPLFQNPVLSGLRLENRGEHKEIQDAVRIKS